MDVACRCAADPPMGASRVLKNHAEGRLNAKGAALKEDYFLVSCWEHVSGVFLGNGGSSRRSGREERFAAVARVCMRHLPWGKLI